MFYSIEPGVNPLNHFTVVITGACAVKM